ncbi:hypothetical protein JG687_00015375 [Phytophthora cactorum]|uniref:Uncharacterized protein n=2 Tax=Phytophthora cactorum TaxID=29920 RepID=A0A329SBN5_9STRA|nr:hypothetical protein Pcac1_g18177 [Phytophthora cactorum]KAG2842284.1 hypothetical protein PC112_g3067 [Phytophthora cactorum]KAG2922681.1 hypothetical protein PC114_g5154 [Phytophthora cactorum]KAG3031504.1 hypothetical protein PC120_g3083 [Phytophthora cactorum]KAG3224173.1 hypothetical protein PC129_g5163 [Phytophthora cactorum]
MWTSVTQDQIDQLAKEAFLPIVLLLNYTLLVYLTMFYWKRRRERRVMLLLFVGTLGTVVTIPFARPEQGFVETVNDISEACCVLTFLLQITIIGYDLNKKFKMRSVMYLTYVAELLTLADLVSILLSCVVVFDSEFMSENTGQAISNAAENSNLAFIFVFRFYYIGISRGWRSIWRTRKFEVGCYLLFATHEMPFDVLSSASGLNWEFAQAIWHRITLTACLFITARSKIKSAGNTATRTTASSANSGRDKWNNDTTFKNSKGNLRRILDGKVLPTFDIIRKSAGRSDRSGGRRSSTGLQSLAVTSAKQPGNQET